MEKPVNNNGEAQAEVVTLLRAMFDALGDLGKRVQALEDGEPELPEVSALEWRLARLEGSDFAQNRKDYQRLQADLENGMPGVPLYPE